MYPGPCRSSHPGVGCCCNLRFWNNKLLFERHCWGGGAYSAVQVSWKRSMWTRAAGEVLCFGRSRELRCTQKILFTSYPHLKEPCKLRDREMWLSCRPRCCTLVVWSAAGRRGALRALFTDGRQCRPVSVFQDPNRAGAVVPESGWLRSARLHYVPYNWFRAHNSIYV